MVRKGKEYLTPQLNGPSEFNGAPIAGSTLRSDRQRRRAQRSWKFFRYKTSGNGYFFPEAETYAVVHIVDERRFEAV